MKNTRMNIGHNECSILDYTYYSRHDLRSIAFSDPIKEHAISSIIGGLNPVSGDGGLILPNDMVKINSIYVSEKERHKGRATAALNYLLSYYSDSLIIAHVSQVPNDPTDAKMVNPEKLVGYGYGLIQQVKFLEKRGFKQIRHLCRPRSGIICFCLNSNSIASYIHSIELTFEIDPKDTKNKQSSNSQ